jgi:prepilin signal peptidase PulO-like enzyme (type II secretory pathway)
MHCKRELRVFDLVPLFSFMYLRGRCRYCDKKLSWQYPLVELTTALIFVLLVLDYGLRITDYGFWFQLVFVCFLIVIAVFDWKHYLILDKVLIPAAVLAIVADILSNNLGFGLLSGLGLAGFFGLQFFLSKGRWIGFGDVKLGFLLGLMLGWPQILTALILAYFAGAFIGLSLIAWGKKQMSSKLPFGVFLCGSAIVVILWGSQITNWYLKLIGL